MDARRLRRYSAWLNSREFAASTIARRLASLRSFYRFQRRCGAIQTSPTEALRNPKQPKRLPRLLRVEEIIGLLDSIVTDTPLGIRDRSMFETLYGGGLRVGELVGLNLEDIDLEQQLLRVRGKGKRGATLPDWSDVLVLDYQLAAGSPAEIGRRTGGLPQSVWRASHHPERRPAHGDPPRQSGPRPVGQSSHPPAQLRHPLARSRCRPPECSGTARPSKFDDDANLHACH